MFNCDKVTEFFLQARRHFSRSHAAKCAQNDSRTMFALQKHCHSNKINIINSLPMILKTQKNVYHQLLRLYLIFYRNLNSPVDDKLSQITCSASRSQLWRNIANEYYGN